MDRSIGSTGFSRIDVVAVAVLAGLGLFIGYPLWAAFERDQSLANKQQCGDNLRTIAKAMEAYANDYDGALPVAGGRGTRWTGHLHDWSAPDRSQAFALDPNGNDGGATVSSSLYLLVRCRHLDPQSFVCPVDRGTRGFQPEIYGMDNKGLGDLWDFGPDPARHCSYAYQIVYSPYKITTAGEPGFAIAADRSPWMDGPSGKAGEFSRFMPDLKGWPGKTEQARQGNSPAHQRDGQNVVFLDMHVAYEKRPHCGFKDENIYTSWDDKERVRGKPPKLGSLPADRRDSLLVNDPPAARR